MIKNIFTFVVALVLSATAAADDFSLYLQPNEGETASWALSGLQKMTFQNGNMILTMKDGSTNSAAISDIKRMYFGAAVANSINDAEQEEPYRWDGTTLHCSSAKGAIATIYQPSGAMVRKERVQDNGAVSLSSLPEGLYIVRINNINIKIIKR